MNCHRSALSLTLSEQIGTDERIKRFFKGVAKKKPQVPRYSVTWDPRCVLNYIETLGSNDDMCLSKLTVKLVILLALITAQRVRTLSLIRVENIREVKDVVQIYITDRVKTFEHNRNQPLLVAPILKEQPLLCVASTILSYVDRTMSIRSLKDSYLLLTYEKPFHMTSPQTIRRWIKDALNKSGVDTTIFSAHSTRHAATSKALRMGVNIERIRQAAGWTEGSSVFARSYNRSVIQPQDFVNCF